MSLTADQIGSKALEADFFLRKMPAATADLFEFRCYVSAFVSAVRGIPVAMEADLGARPDFRAWLETWQHRLDENRIARCFAGIRVDTLRISHVPAHLDRSHWVRFGLWESKHHFVEDPAAGAEPVPELDVMDACAEYLTLWAAMVLDCYETFQVRIPTAIWSVPGLATLGVTVDDIEEHLGFPRGWTAAPERSDDDRLALLRHYAPEASIDRFFLRYCNRTRREPAGTA